MNESEYIQARKPGFSYRWLGKCGYPVPRMEGTGFSPGKCGEPAIAEGRWTSPNHGELIEPLCLKHLDRERTAGE